MTLNFFFKNIFEHISDQFVFKTYYRKYNNLLCNSYSISKKETSMRFVKTIRITKWIFKSISINNRSGNRV